MYGRDYVYEHRYADHGYPFWEWLVPLLLFGLLIGVASWAVWRLTSRSVAVAPAVGPGPDPAIEALRLRYARGEVSSDEFAAIAAGLGAPASAAAWPTRADAPTVETPAAVPEPEPVSEDEPPRPPAA